ncbi:Stk1 family PASTA domain-containing Ser/Thr kinase [Pseudobacteroides cellulosolvens]|uniref:non-specific serine/threonine protein kinase n=1 Tax=Pseudobacteroides cellulosolvens ATCC 35603 = DSM 2933 TaxID=398512 RepID=A0A0L6JRW1_9FIRM|nr:Stk1 family PASTA domain-containing Ser/Thr kinase [Pseudobacteroides cellulosolvens]KNY28132.1 serine/threonine protein kinase with PASTA sensor(s) [Pseudobacteroides cellulosolvens ATCC 35603 = DSM 2933]
MEGQILGNRYELIEKIGGGGMALVYKAKCSLLNRFVAVKILRQEFTNDQEFVKRFRIEAQSAASLSYPNIVSIYDVGQEGNIHYIVMEYIEGVTLKDYIAEKGALDWKEAVNIELQICSAIEHAHKKRIVHRDIKPHNILITKDGIVKVTDFGIARAVSSSTITMVGSTIGSVHYFSPEQARGGFTDEKSDLYSLGIALYEMVTGKVPFDGETPVAIALKHLQEMPEEPINIKGDLPKGVNSIIMKAIQKEQSNRYSTATELLNDLRMVLNDPSSVPSTKIDIDNSPTRRIQIVQPDKPIETVVKEPQVKEVPAKETQEEEIDDMKNKKKDRVTWILAIATSLLIIGIFVFIAFKFIGPSIMPPAKSDFVLENYEGKNIDDVKQALEGEGITVVVERKNDKSVEKDIIITQKPKEGTKIKPDPYNPVTFSVSNGPEMVKIPDLSKKTSREAQKILEDYNLIARVEDEFSDVITSGLVVRTEPGIDEEVSPGSSVTIYLSKGPEIIQTVVPNLIGLTRVQAQKALSDNKLTLGKVLPEDSANHVDKIVNQDPPPNTTVTERSAVNITLETVNTNTQIPNQGATPNGNHTPTPLKASEVSVSIPLENADSFGETVRVLIEMTPSDTKKSTVIMDGTVNKQDFPLAVKVPVPENGSTNIKVYVDNKPNSDMNVDYPGGR